MIPLSTATSPFKSAPAKQIGKLSPTRHQPPETSVVLEFCHTRFGQRINVHEFCNHFVRSLKRSYHPRMLVPGFCPITKIACARSSPPTVTVPFHANCFRQRPAARLVNMLEQSGRCFVPNCLTKVDRERRLHCSPSGRIEMASSGEPSELSSLAIERRLHPRRVAS